MLGIDSKDLARLPFGLTTVGARRSKTLVLGLLLKAVPQRLGSVQVVIGRTVEASLKRLLHPPLKILEIMGGTIDRAVVADDAPTGQGVIRDGRAAMDKIR